MSEVEKSHNVNTKVEMSTSSLTLLVPRLENQNCARGDVTIYILGSRVAGGGGFLHAPLQTAHFFPFSRSFSSSVFM